MTLTKGDNDNECDDDDDDKNLLYYMGAYPSWSVQGAEEVFFFFFFLLFYFSSHSLFFTKHIIVGLLFRNMHPSITISFHSLIHTSFHNSFWRFHIYTYTQLQEVILSSKNIYNIKVKNTHTKTLLLRTKLVFKKSQNIST